MKLSTALILLFYFPIVCCALFVSAMIFSPDHHKIAVYRVFFTQGFWLTIPYLLAAVATTVVAVRARRWGAFNVASIMLLAAAVVFYARYIEPRRIVVQEHTIEVGASLRIAFIADLHIGIFDGESRMKQIVDELNRLDVDVVAVGGDWTDEAQRPLLELLAPIAKSKHRVIAVLGNHDEGMPGIRVVEELQAALIQLNVENIEGKIVEVKQVRIAGIGDRFAKKDNLPPFDPSKPPQVVLGHNPDSIARLNNTPVRLLLAGHTHGGQINLPILTEYILSRFTEGKYKQGLYTKGNSQVFVTAGLGTVGFPLRLFQPPVIDIINLR
ncbi:MAG: phosphohydrolase [Burkholderiales bacterium]|nr:MAG: phosphohydrolase [Burkholderiales bacterium]TAG83036.1 MAG: phosphohydrolase [Betaproteobacteria bacterium]